MSNNLTVIQKFIKIGRILATIGFIASLIGLAGLTLGFACMAIFPANAALFSIAGVDFYSMVNLDAGTAVETALTTMAMSAVSTAVSCVICLKLKQYLTHVENAGTLFSIGSAADLKSVGIVMIAAPIIGGFISGLIGGLMNAFMNVPEVEFSTSEGSIVAGVLFIFISYLIAYVVEQRNGEVLDPELETASSLNGI